MACKQDAAGSGLGPPASTRLSVVLLSKHLYQMRLGVAHWISSTHGSVTPYGLAAMQGNVRALEGYAGECLGNDPAGWDVWQLMGVEPPLSPEVDPDSPSDEAGRGQVSDSPPPPVQPVLSPPPASQEEGVPATPGMPSAAVPPPPNRGD